MWNDDDEPKSRELPTGFGGRTLKTVKLAGQLGKAYLARSLDRSGAGDDGLSVEQAVELVDEFSALRGMVAKFGQMVSYLPGDLSEEAREILSQLQDRMDPMPFEQVDEVFRHEFGRSPGELFDDFEPEPFASASIGQVHRARHDDRQLAVKVQYPHIQKAVDRDLRNVGTLVKMTTFGMPIDGASLAAELRDRIGQECDYERELKNQRLFRRLFDQMPGCRVPRAFDRWSARRILVSEFVDAASFQEFVATAPKNSEIGPERSSSGRASTPSFITACTTPTLIPEITCLTARRWSFSISGAYATSTRR